MESGGSQHTPREHQRHNHHHPTMHMRHSMNSAPSSQIGVAPTTRNTAQVKSQDNGLPQTNTINSFSKLFSPNSPLAVQGQEVQNNNISSGYHTARGINPTMQKDDPQQQVKTA